MAFSQSALRARIDLTARELLAISQEISREFAPRYVKGSAIPTPAVPTQSPAFSSKELLAISQEISRDFAPRPTANHTGLTLLPIDPRRLYAYWQIAKTGLPASPQSSSNKSASEQTLTLRVFQQAEPPITDLDSATPELCFEFPIAPAQNQQEIILPAETIPSGAKYCAAIGVCHGGQEFTAIAYSNYANVPSAPTTRQESDLSENVAQFMLQSMNASSSLNKAATSQEK